MQQQGKISFPTTTCVKNTALDPSSVEQSITFYDTKVARKTLFFDCLRYIFHGALNEELRTVILLLAIRLLNMPVGCKMALNSLGFLSMLLAPITQQLANRSRWNNMQISALYFALMGLAFFCAAFSSSWITFFIFITLAHMCDKQQIPMMIGTYGDNYIKNNRGLRVGLALACMPIGGILFSQIVGCFLEKGQENFTYILLSASILALCCAGCFLKIPAQKIAIELPPPLWDNFKFIAKDRLFASFLLFYSFIAIANQMTLPLRMEYLANHRHTLGISGATIVAIFAIIQPLASTLSSPLWGKLYDHVNLITMRQCVTACFLVGLPLFFATDNLSMIYLASILLGIGRSGGVIFWSLWVGEIAPKEKVTEYMSANAAIMGLRDALAPIIGYFLLTYTGPLVVGIIAFVLLALSMLGFESIYRHPSYTQRMIKIKK
ncbi:MAG: MFS transporter [Puniceicoccales bacterium]|jgi:hypothetical protein|nr:MFS transporter [Puniceicoccales bacterium]